jgi:succinyl-diaminopimelate desuccinylase
MPRVCRYARPVTHDPPALARHRLALRDRLARRTLELVDIPSESRHEAEVRAHLRSLVPPSFAAEYAAEDAFVFARERRPGVPLVLLVGHYDTVPAQDNVPGRIADGAVHGCGTTDMKGGVAVAVELVRDLAEREPGPYDVALLLFGKEELPAQFSPLPDLFERSQIATAADLAILLEPTDLTIQAGCLGNLNAQLTFTGVSGHSARPWTAENAIEKAIEGLAPIAAHERREAIVGGLPFYEVVSITMLEAGIASNVIPDRAVATLNFRYAPDRAPASAEEYLRSLVPDGARIELTGDSPPAAVVTDTPLVRALRDAGDLTFEPKQAWTNVADFTTRGIDAVNFGPGATRYAHRRDELVEIDALVRAYETLLVFLTEA